MKSFKLQEIFRDKENGSELERNEIKTPTGYWVSLFLSVCSCFNSISVYFKVIFIGRLSI